MTSDRIDPFSPVPAYQQVAALIRRRIESGELSAGDPIPSQNTIMQQFGIARQTAHKALRVLVQAGLVVVVPGRGAIVLPRDTGSG